MKQFKQEIATPVKKSRIYLEDFYSPDEPEDSPIGWWGEDADPIPLTFGDLRKLIEADKALDQMSRGTHPRFKVVRKDH